MFEMLKKSRENRAEGQAISKLKKEYNSREPMMLIGQAFKGKGSLALKDGDKLIVEVLDEAKATEFCTISSYPEKDRWGKPVEDKRFSTITEAELYKKDTGKTKGIKVNVALLVYVHKFTSGGDWFGKPVHNGKPGETYTSREDYEGKRQGKLAILTLHEPFANKIEEAAVRYKGLEGKVFEFSRSGSTAQDTSYGFDYVDEKFLPDGIKQIEAMPKTQAKKILSEAKDIDIQETLFPRVYEDLRDALQKQEEKNFKAAGATEVLESVGNGSSWT